MSDDRRNVLKQLLSGRITGREAAGKLKVNRDSGIPFAIHTSDGLYTMRGESGLTREEVFARADGDLVLMAGEDQASLIATVNRLNQEAQDWENRKKLKAI